MAWEQETRIGQWGGSSFHGHEIQPCPASKRILSTYRYIYVNGVSRFLFLLLLLRMKGYPKRIDVLAFLVFEMEIGRSVRRFVAGSISERSLPLNTGSSH